MARPRRADIALHIETLAVVKLGAQRVAFEQRRALRADQLDAHSLRSRYTVERQVAGCFQRLVIDLLDFATLEIDLRELGSGEEVRASQVPVAVLTYYATHPQSYYRTGLANPDFPGMARDQRQVATGVPHIHFNGASKPWSYFCDHPLKHEYDK